MVRTSRLCAIVLLSGLVLPLASCATAIQPTVVSARPSVEKTEDPAPDPRAAAPKELGPDPTLYADEYEARGIPSVENPWTVGDYQNAIPALVALAKEDSALLPRSNSKHSGSVFRRMVSRDNLELYARQDMDWQIRHTSLMALVQIMPAILAAYVGAIEQGQPVDREVLECMLQQGHLVAMVWHTVDEIAPTIYRNDAGLSQRMASLETMQLGVGNVGRGMITMLHDRQSIRLENHIWYASELQQLLPDLVSRMLAPDQAEARERIARLAATEPEPALAKQLKLLQAALVNLPEPRIPRPPNMSMAP